MRAGEITKQTLVAMDKNYDAIIVIFSNPEMIGRTGDYKATIKASEFVDKCVKKIVKFAEKRGYNLLITADHGNAEEMRTKNGGISTSHSLNKVLAVAIADQKIEMKKNGELKDIAPTFLDLMGVKNSPHFEGETLSKTKL
jgi:2,3-bisphosphoglycerate-independent phosphoglycerate mutase